MILVETEESILVYIKIKKKIKISHTSVQVADTLIKPARLKSFCEKQTNLASTVM